MATLLYTSDLEEEAGRLAKTTNKKDTVSAVIPVAISIAVQRWPACCNKQASELKRSWLNASLSRRTFLHLVGAFGGSTAVYRAAVGMGLLPVTAHTARPDIAPLRSRDRKSVLILGAGMSGLAAAYELSRKGYDVQVIEASHRPGGRNLTLRGGDLVDEAEYPQRCDFDRDPDLYFNAGPARIPGHHASLLGYCKELGVSLAPVRQREPQRLGAGRRDVRRPPAAQSRIHRGLARLRR